MSFNILLFGGMASLSTKWVVIMSLIFVIASSILFLFYQLFHPYLQDFYEARYLFVRQSGVDGAGEGLWAKCHINAGQVYYWSDHVCDHVINNYFFTTMTNQRQRDCQVSHLQVCSYVLCLMASESTGSLSSYQNIKSNKVIFVILKSSCQH